MKNISSVHFENETSMEQSILLQGSLEGMYFVDFKANIGTWFVRRADLIAIADDFSWWQL